MPSSKPALVSGIAGIVMIFAAVAFYAGPSKELGAYTYGLHGRP